jgi:Kef-type K+ transport system membrane component KefB
MTSPPAVLAAGSAVEAELLTVLIQLVVIITVGRLFAIAARRVGQPAAVGEILAGLSLGPSLLGGLSAAAARNGWWSGSSPEWLLDLLPVLRTDPDVLGAVFDPAVGPLFTMLAQLGLILLLFAIGLEFDFSHLRAKGAAAVSISVIGIVLPFGLGLAITPLLLPYIGLTRFDRPPDALEFALFLGTAMCITAIPILGRMMIELNIHRARVGAVTISAAAVDDAAGWILLATVGGLARARAEGGGFDPWAAGRMIAETVGFALAVMLLVRPVMRGLLARSLAAHGGELTLTTLTALLAAIFVCAIATNRIGIFSIFGAFFLGAALSDTPGLREAFARAVGRLTTAFFLPIFFTYTGLRTDVGSLDGPLLWALCGLVLAAAFLGKLGGCAIAARISGFPWRESLCIGMMMNTRALMELIVINEGYNLGVLTRSSFVMLVIMALLSTVVTTPALLRLARGSELADLVAGSELAGARPGATPAGAIPGAGGGAAE